MMKRGVMAHEPCLEEKKDVPEEASRTLVLLAGLPGTGKGTTIKHLQGQDGVVTISMGDVLRRYRDDNVVPELTEAIRKGMDERLVQPEVVQQVLSRECSVYAADKAVKMLVLDGIPRTADDARYAKEHLVPLFTRTVFMVLQAKDDVLVDRCVRRGRGDSSTPADVRYRIQKERAAFEAVSKEGVLAPYHCAIDASGSHEDMFANVDRALAP